MTTVIKFENISKQYRLGQVGSGTLADDLHRAWAKLRGKPDPLAKVGQVNDREVSSQSPTAKRQRFFSRHSLLATRSSEYVWALKDICFEVQQGEILGIVGRNGAGKSTLLKLLSRVTAPTTGSIRSKGRIASLLEVGTGFHPELTGRENIYLNGAILGMRYHEITKQLEAIVEFSGCAKYIDTPVKRYSSGMTVRLGFAVAAHLDCVILIVDEVLAVGDAEFQKKCVGKMRDVSARGGKTVLFVSHNLASVSDLTQRLLVLNKGSVSFIGETELGLAEYAGIADKTSSCGLSYEAKVPLSGPGVVSATVRTSLKNGQHECGSTITFDFELYSLRFTRSSCFSFQVCDNQNRPVCHFWLFGKDLGDCDVEGKFRASCRVSNFYLYMGRYSLTTWLSDSCGQVVYESLSEICPFEVSMGKLSRFQYNWQPNEMKYYVNFSWSSGTTSVTNE